MPRPSSSTRLLCSRASECLKSVLSHGCGVKCMFLGVALIRVADWEQKHKRRESKPEDLELIKELQALTQQQKLKMKDLIVRHSLRRSLCNVMCLIGAIGRKTCLPAGADEQGKELQPSFQCQSFRWGAEPSHAKGKRNTL